MHNLLGFDLFVFKLYIICIKDSSSNDKNGNFGGKLSTPFFFSLNYLSYFHKLDMQRLTKLCAIVLGFAGTYKTLVLRV